MLVSPTRELWLMLLGGFMRTYPLYKIWHRTVRGTDLEHLNWDEIALCLLYHEVIGLSASDDAKTFDRYFETDKLPEMLSKKEYHDEIIKILRANCD
jgi:hypothetical protein